MRALRQARPPSGAKEKIGRSWTSPAGWKLTVFQTSTRLLVRARKNGETFWYGPMAPEDIEELREQARAARRERRQHG